MTSMRHVRNTADQAADSKALEYLARAGFVGYGIVHLLFAWLVLQVAFGRPTNDNDQSGALQKLAGQPLGKTLVVLVIIGLVAMAIWQAFEAAIGHRGDVGRTRIAERVASAVRMVVYLYIAFSGYQVLQGASASSSDKQQQTSGQLMGSTGGRWILGLVGLVVACVGVGLAVYGITKRFEKHLHTEQMSAAVRTVSERLGVAGYVAKGVAYALAGGLLVTAAVTFDPGKARGLDGALRTLAAQNYGTWLLTLVGLGIGAYGVFCFVQAKYRAV